MDAKFMSYDYKVAFHSADAFLKNSKLFIHQLDHLEAPNEKTNYAKNNLADLFVSATNLALSIELFLKCLSMILNKKYIESHNLDKLYYEIPLIFRTDSIEKHYKDEGGLKKYHSIDIQAKKNQAPSKGMSKKKPNLEVRKVLARNQNAFVTWRYLFDMKEKNMIELKFEYYSLVLIAETLKKSITQHQKN